MLMLKSDLEDPYVPFVTSRHSGAASRDAPPGATRQPAPQEPLAGHWSAPVLPSPVLGHHAGR